MSEKLTELLLAKEGFEQGIPAQQKIITEAEKKLGLVFSREYKDYLYEFGSVSYRGHILTGISPFPGIDVVKVTNDARRYNTEINNSLYVIEEVNIDGIVIWQDDSGAVFQTMPGSKPVKIADSLYDYLQA